MTEAEFQRFAVWAEKHCPRLDRPVALLLKEYKEAQRPKPRKTARMNDAEFQRFIQWCKARDPAFKRPTHRLMREYKAFLSRVEKCNPPPDHGSELPPLEPEYIRSTRTDDRHRRGYSVKEDNPSWDNFVRDYEDRWEVGHPTFDYMRD